MAPTSPGVRCRQPYRVDLHFTIHMAVEADEFCPFICWVHGSQGHYGKKNVFRAVGDLDELCFVFYGMLRGSGQNCTRGIYFQIIIGNVSRSSCSCLIN
jgi:hypothetical protein